MKVLLANHDSCGDILCGNRKFKNEIETILKKNHKNIKMILLSSILSVSCILIFF